MQFFWETTNHPDDSAPLQPRFDSQWLLAFPKTKITFEREEISEHWWDSGKSPGSWWWLGELCEVLKSWLSKGLRCHFPTYNVSCISYLLQWMSLFFILHGCVLSGQISYIHRESCFNQLAHIVGEKPFQYFQSRPGSWKFRQKLMLQYWVWRNSIGENVPLQGISVFSLKTFNFLDKAYP